MSKFVVAVLALIAGCVIGVVGVLIAFGFDTGLGVAVGMSAGICETLKAAQDGNLLTDAQAAQVFGRAADGLRATGASDLTSLVGSFGDCDGVLSQLQNQTGG